MLKFQFHFYWLNENGKPKILQSFTAFSDIFFKDINHKFTRSCVSRAVYWILYQKLSSSQKVMSQLNRLSIDYYIHKTLYLC